MMTLPLPLSFWIFIVYSSPTYNSPTKI